MEKDSYWFRHDSTAGRGLRMRKMAHIYGHWGKGIYWDVIEILRDQSNYCFNSDDSSLQMLADLIGCKDEKKFISWFRDCIRFDLFRICENMFYSEVLCKNMKKWEATKHAGIQSGKSRKATKTELTSNETRTNLEHNIIEEDIIEDNNKGFSAFWDLYNKKVGAKDKCESKWNKLTDAEREKIMQTLPAFLGSIKDKQFQPYAETYLNQKRWNDDLSAVNNTKSLKPHGSARIYN